MSTLRMREKFRNAQRPLSVRARCAVVCDVCEHVLVVNWSINGSPLNLENFC